MTTANQQKQSVVENFCKEHVGLLNNFEKWIATRENFHQNIGKKKNKKKWKI